LPKLDKGTRSCLLECVANREAVDAWLATVDELKRARLNHPTVVLRAWRTATGPKPGRRETTPLARRLEKVSAEEFLEAASPELREQLVGCLHRQEDSLAAAKTHDRELSKHLVELAKLALEGKDVARSRGSSRAKS
jgi:hypothetical protein